MTLGARAEPRVPFVDLAAIDRPARAAIDTAIADVIGRRDFILGAAVDAFEARFAAYCEARHAVGVDSGFSAIELALRACDIGPGDEVITVANTFVATAGAIVATGATPVLVDADPATHQIDPDRIADAVTDRTRAVVPVHLYGHLADLDAVDAIADRHGLTVIEDACQAHGARSAGRRAGTLGDAAAFSFYPSKNLGAYGDGGMVVTDDPEIDRRVRLLRNLGSTVKYHHETIGYNHRLDTLQAAVLSAKLDHLDRANDERRQLAAAYDELLAGLDLAGPQPRPGSEPVHHLYVVQSPERDALQAHLERAGVSTGIHYPVPIHLQPAFAGLGYGPGRFPVAERLAGEILSLPLYPGMPPGSVERVARAVWSYFEGGNSWS